MENQFKNQSTVGEIECDKKEDSKKIKLDNKDKEILYQLDLNARQSNAEIARKLGLNKNAISYRIKRLEKLGVIEGYDTIIDFSKLGFFLFRVYIDFYEFYIEKEKRLLDYLRKEKKIYNFNKTVGDWNIVIDIYSKDLNEFYKTFYKILNNFREIIKNYDIEMVVEERIILRKYLTKEKTTSTNFLKLGDMSKEKIDDTDQEIINLLIDNAKIPITDLASKLKITEMAIIHRIKKLIKKKIIVGYKVRINLDSIGYKKYKIFLELEDTNIIGTLIDYFEKKKFLTRITQAIGNNIDFRLELEIPSSEKIYNVILDLKSKFPKKIRDYKYILFY